MVWVHGTGKDSAYRWIQFGQTKQHSLFTSIVSILCKSVMNPQQHHGATVCQHFVSDPVRNVNPWNAIWTWMCLPYSPNGLARTGAVVLKQKKSPSLMLSFLLNLTVCHFQMLQPFHCKSILLEWGLFNIHQESIASSLILCIPRSESNNLCWAYWIIHSIAINSFIKVCSIEFAIHLTTWNWDWREMIQTLSCKMWIKPGMPSQPE